MAWEVARLIQMAPEQTRPALNCNAALTTAATWRAQSLADGDYFAHCDPAGVCPNDYARRAGCDLGPDYGAGNQIESLVAGTGDAQKAFYLLMGSIEHEAHLMGLGTTGLGALYAGQDDIGVATVYKAGTKYGWYTVVLIADCL